MLCNALYQERDEYGGTTPAGGRAAGNSCSCGTAGRSSPLLSVATGRPASVPSALAAERSFARIRALDVARVRELVPQAFCRFR